MKVDAYAELYLRNRSIDQLLRILQRLENLSIRSKQQLKAYEIRLEEIRAGLNADFAEAMVAQERTDETRLWRQRTAWEKKNAGRAQN